VCADTEEFADEQREEGADNLFPEQSAEAASSVALEGRRWFEGPKCSCCRPNCRGGEM